MRVLLFGGTTEGRELASWLAARGCDVTACSATRYGEELLGHGEHVESRTGPLPDGEMERLMREGGYCCVVDATHPYAEHITSHVERAARAAGLPRLRIVREDEPVGPWTACADAEEAAGLLRDLPGKVLLATGVKELGVFTRALPDAAARVYARVLPSAESLARALSLGIPAPHIVAMQGPFSQQMNEAILREFDISVLVTKASGVAGGFWEKIGAARACGARAVVISRPRREKGLGLEQAKRELEAWYGI